MPGLIPYSTQAEIVVVMSAKSTVNNLDKDQGLRDLSRQNLDLSGWQSGRADRTGRGYGATRGVSQSGDREVEFSA